VKHPIRLYCSPHPYTYRDGGIINSLALHYADRRNAKFISLVTERYNLLNSVYFDMLDRGVNKVVDYPDMPLGLDPEDRKLLSNRLRNRQRVILPIRVTIEKYNANQIDTLEYGRIHFLDRIVLPDGCDEGLLMMFQPKDKEGECYLRLGFRLSGKQRQDFRQKRRTIREHRLRQERVNREELSRKIRGVNEPH
jgi:hypothetical protein